MKKAIPDFKKLAGIIFSERSEILSSWIRQIKSLGGGYLALSDSELASTTADFLGAFIEALGKGNFLKLRIFIEKISHLRSSRGFRVSEVQRAIYALYGVLSPMIEKLMARGEVSRGALNSINNILTEALFDLSEAYHKRLNEAIDNYICEIENTNLRLKESSIKDELTGCYNRRYFYEILDSEISRARRYGRPLSLAMFDLDHFKKFNDKFGHPTGDKVLKALCNILNKGIRASDMAFRYGGEEFSIIFSETPKEKALISCERIREKVS